MNFLRSFESRRITLKQRMRFVREIICIALVLVCESHAHSYRLSGCPKVKVMKDFDMAKFYGDWFVVGRYNPLATCIKVNVEKGEDEAITVHESYRPFGIHFGHDVGPRKGRKLTVLSNDTDAIFKLQQRLFSIGLKTYGVVDTDYTNYAVVWGCDPLVVGTVQNLDVLSRTPDVKMEEIKSLAEKANVDIQPLEKVNQKNCETSHESGSPEKNGINNMYVEK